MLETEIEQQIKNKQPEFKWSVSHSLNEKIKSFRKKMKERKITFSAEEFFDYVFSKVDDAAINEYLDIKTPKEYIVMEAMDNPEELEEMANFLKQRRQKAGKNKSSKL